MRVTPYHCTLRQLQYAVAVAESLSFREAAERCRISQPSLSEQLSQLEAMLGVRLFERDRRRVLVTSAGRAILERAKRVLRATDDLVVLARRSRDPFSGTLRIGVIPTISPYLLPRLMPAFGQAYPHLSVRWVEDKTKPLIRSLEAGRLDAALLSIESDIGDVEKDVIARDPFVLVVPRHHVLAKKATPIRATELRGDTVLVLQEAHCFGQQSADFCAHRHASIDAFRATSLATLIQMVKDGAGITMLPELAVQHEATSRQLCVRTFAGTGPFRTIGLVWRKQHPFDAALRQVAGTIRGAYPTVPAGRRSRRGRSSHGVIVQQLAGRA